jgi:hypothetical protein
MVNNPALWFVIGVVAAVVVHTAWKFFTRYWEYQSDINALDLRITNLQGELEEYRRHFDFRLNSNFQHLNNKINTLSDRVTALEPKKTK